MTREEATKYAGSKKMMLESLIYNDDCKYGNYAMYSAELSFINAVLSALRPVSREQVEKVWRGEWVEEPYSTKSERNRIIHSKKCICSVCNKSNGRKKEIFCPSCGAPMTDEAVQMVMGRLEALYEQTN